MRVGDGGLAFYDTDIWEPIPGRMISDVVAMRYTRDGLLTLSAGRVVNILDPETLEAEHSVRLPVLEGEENIAPHLSNDGLLLFRETNLTFYDLLTGQPVGTTFPETERGIDPTGVSSAQGLQLATIVGSNMIVWNMDTGTWRDAVCRAVGRNLTLEEWEKYGPSREYAPTCSQWPAGT